MAKKSRKKTKPAAGTNGQDHGAFLRDYKGYTIYDVGSLGPGVSGITIEKNGEIVNRVDYKSNATNGLNKGIETAKALIDKGNLSGALDQPAGVVPLPGKEAGEYEFTKIKLRDQHFIDVVFVREYTDAAYPVRNPGTSELNWPIHDDLKAALQKFAVHWLVMAGYVEAKKIKGEIEDFDHPLIDQVKITTVSLTGANMDQVSISGHRMIFGRAVNANVIGKFYDADGEGYSFGTSLEILWHELTDETIQLINGKRGALVQPELPFGEKDAAGDPIVETAL